MAKKKRDSVEEMIQFSLFGDQPISTQEPPPVPILENWRTMGSFFVATEADAAGDTRVLRADGAGDVAESPIVAGELLVMGLLGPEIPSIPRRHHDRVRHLIDLRDCTRRLLQAQRAGAPDSQTTELRGALNTAYDTFVARYGRLNAVSYTARGKPKRANLAHFESDPDFSLLAALEIDLEHATYREPEGQEEVEEIEYEKAPLFFRNTIRQDIAPDSAESPMDALAISLDQKGGVDLEYMSGLLTLSRADVAQELLGEIFQDPETGEYVTKAEYLSGPVRRKLRIAQRALELESRWKINVQALEAVQPQDLTEEEIIVSLGVPWVPTEDALRFAEETFGLRPGMIRIIRDEVHARWTVRVDDIRAKLSPKVTREWGTGRVNAFDLFEAALNQQVPTVTDPHPDIPNRRVTNLPETLRARERKKDLNEEFRKWVWKDDERRQRLLREYNDLFNDQVERVYDGTHLTLAGSAEGIELRGLQKNGIFRSLQTRNTLVAHGVGYGKTWTQAGAIMEARRLGMASKPIWLVPNNMLASIPRQFVHLYPMARVMVPTEKDMTPAGREEFFARMVTSDPDCVIMSHHQFDKLPTSVESQRQAIREAIEALERPVPEADRRYLDQRDKDLRKLRGSLAALDGLEDHGLTFEDAGFDMLVVDESHIFKKIPLDSANQSVRDPGSGLAKELLMRVRMINRAGGKVIFASGTPLTNTLFEAYSLMVYLYEDRLREMGLHNVDAWIAMFAEMRTHWELNPAGKYEAKTRFSAFNNQPELRAHLRHFADVMLDRLEDLGIPEMESGKPMDTVVEPDEWFHDHMEGLVARVEAIRNRRPLRRNDNMLAICTDARKASIDGRLIDPAAPSSASKIPALVAQVAERHHATAEERGVQLIFCDIGTPSTGGFNVYEEVKQQLVAAGIPAGEIAFAQDAKGEGAKDRFDDAVNRGEIRVAIGSTSTMGIGRNIQERVRGILHLDIPWRPDMMEQRNGRGLRQGNQYDEVAIERFALSRSFDTFIIQANERKAAASYALLAGGDSRRTVEDIDEVTLSFKAFKAIASGDPRVVRKQELEDRIARLEVILQGERRQRHSARQELSRIPARRDRFVDAANHALLDVETLVDTQGDKFLFRTPQGTEITERKEAGRVFLARFLEAEKHGVINGSAEVNVGEIGDFQIRFEKAHGFPVDLVLRNHGTYRVVVDASADAVSAIGLVRRTENLIESIPGKREGFQRELDDLDKSEKELNALISGDTPREHEMRSLVLELEEIDRELGIREADEEVPSEVLNEERENPERDEVERVLPRAAARAGQALVDADAQVRRPHGVPPLLMNPEARQRHEAERDERTREALERARRALGGAR